MKVSIKIEDLPKELKAREKASRAALVRGITYGARRGQRILMRSTPVDTGQAKAGWKVGAGGRIGSRGGIAAVLTNDAPHVGIIEKGARPHKVSPEGWLAIYRWVVRHRKEFGFTSASGRARKPKKAGRTVHPMLPDVKDLDPRLATITWHIVRKIGREGQKPTYFVRGALPNLSKAMRLEIMRELRELSKQGKLT